MGLITEKIFITIGPNVKYYRDLNYNVKFGDKIEIPIDHLPKKSRVRIKVQCDGCGDVKEIKYQDYNNNIKNQNIYTCHKCKHIKSRQTCLDKYGESNYRNIKKQKKTKKERYGDETYTNPDKRKKTNLEKYGSELIGWNIKELHDKGEQTCLKRYGKFSWQIALDKKTNKTSIEQKIEIILLFNNINYNYEYCVKYNNTYKVYDFYLSDYNILIEADGDYWHANPNKYKNLNELNETQITNINNDKIKNKLSKDAGFILLRFWECDIMKDDFEDILVNYIKSQNGSNPISLGSNNSPI